MPQGKSIKGRDRRPAVIWDIEEMITVYGTVVGIEEARDEIRLLFGNRIVQGGPQKTTIMVSDRIIVNPYMAKRLLVFLNKFIERHELPAEIEKIRLHAFMETRN